MNIRAYCAALLSAAIVLSSIGISYAANFSISYIKHYQFDWAPDVPVVEDCANGFRNSLDNISTFRWSRSEHNVTSLMFESKYNSYWVGTYDIHYHSGHGSEEGPAMFVNGSYGTSSLMELGPELEWLCLCSCMVIGQSNPWLHFKNSFQNGLHGVTGGYRIIYPSGDEGDKFADNLRDGDTILESWLDSHDDSGGSPGVVFTGTSGANCWYRIENEKYWGFSPVFSDPSPASYWCRYHRN